MRRRRRSFRRRSTARSSRFRPRRGAVSRPGRSISGRLTKDVTVINHRKGIFIPKEMNWDCFDTSGAARVTSLPGAQAVLSRSFCQGGAAFRATLRQHGTGFGTDLVQASIGGTTDAQKNSRRMCWKTQTNLTFTNFGNAPAHCVLYIMRANSDQLGATDLAGNKALFPHVLWNNFLQTMKGLNSVTSTNLDVLGLRPFQAPAFGAYWNIIKTRKFILDAGASLQHIVKTFEFYSYNWMKLGREADDTQRAKVILKGRTWAYMLICNGGPGADTTTPSFVSITPASIGCSWTFKMWTANVPHPSTTVSQALNDTDPFSGDGQNFVIDETGIVSAFDAA